MFCNKKTDVYIYTNLCEDTIVGDKELPLLRRVYLKTSSPNEIFTHPYEVPTRLGQVHDEGCIRTGGLISARKYVCDAGTKVEKDLKKGGKRLDRHTFLIREYGNHFTKTC
jgi:hypothetical protein